MYIYSSISMGKRKTFPDTSFLYGFDLLLKVSSNPPSMILLLRAGAAR